MTEILVPDRPVSTLAKVVGHDRMLALEQAGRSVRKALAGRTVWQVNTTARGGGVAEMLTALLPYPRHGKVEARWLVVEGDSRFFDIAKRLCLILYGAEDVAPLTDADTGHYFATLTAAATRIGAAVTPSDVVVLHDPQTVGLIPAIKNCGASVVWRCHIGADHVTPLIEAMWRILGPYLDDADLLVFSAGRLVPASLSHRIGEDRIRIISPSIDPLSPKNRPMDRSETLVRLRAAGLLRGIPAVSSNSVVTGPPPPPDVPLVVQVSRWDPLKDMTGVMRAFAASVEDAHLLLAGPDVASVADDPAAVRTFRDCLARWRTLPRHIRERIHLVTLPMADPVANALVVNALQRHATVVAQKSLAEGFGLTVTEAMWKSRPVVASAVGGIAEQITSGADGLLITDPHDLDAFGSHLARTLEDAATATALGDRAHCRAHRDFLPDRHLIQWAQAITDLTQSVDRRQRQPL